MLDTSVLLADPGALQRFDEHEVVLPVVVITELEGKRHHPELGYFARAALRMLDELRVAARPPRRAGPGRRRGRHAPGRAQPHRPRRRCRPASALGDNDTRILAVARNLANEGRDVTLVSKDLPMRVKASAVGLDAEEYRAEAISDSDSPAGPAWPSSTSTAADLDELYDDGVARPRGGPRPALPHRAGAAVRARQRRSAGSAPTSRCSWSAATGRRSACTAARAEQRIALDLLLDPEVGIVSLGGRAGTGKSALALCAGLEAVMERRQHKKVVVFRPLFAVGGQELGYLPGSESEKMKPWAQAVFDTLGALTSRDVIDEVLDRGMLEVLPLTHIRGRSLHDAFVIVDEAQSLERNVLLTVLSRIGANSRVVLTHDVAQRDNLRVGRHDGVVAVVEKLKGHPLFAHVTLTRSERSPIAALVTEMLENVTL